VTMTQSAICATNSRFSSSRFTGKERDTESGNDYFEARYYASSFGRFMSPDWSAKEEPVPYAKLDDPQSLNLYAYVGNNPMVRDDLDGHGGWPRSRRPLPTHAAGAPGPSHLGTGDDSPTMRRVAFVKVVVKPPIFRPNSKPNKTNH